MLVTIFNHGAIVNRHAAALSAIAVVILFFAPLLRCMSGDYASCLFASGDDGEWRAHQYTEALPGQLATLEQAEFSQTVAVMGEHIDTLLLSDEHFSRGLYLAAALREAAAQKTISDGQCVHIFDILAAPKRAAAIINAMVKILSDDMELTTKEIIDFSLVVYCISRPNVANYMETVDEVTATIAEWSALNKNLGEWHQRLIALHKTLLFSSHKLRDCLYTANVIRLKDFALKLLDSGDTRLKLDSDVFRFYMCFNILRLILQTYPNQLGILAHSIDGAAIKALEVLNAFCRIEDARFAENDNNCIAQADIIRFLTAAMRVLPQHLGRATREAIQSFAYDIGVKSHWNEEVCEAQVELRRAFDSA